MTTDAGEHLHANYAQVQLQIAAACARAGRDPAEITLVAVSKTHPAAVVIAAFEAGLRHFGENRVEEASAKIPAVSSVAGMNDAVWHMVGHIQSRKAKDVPPLFSVVHSVDTEKLAQKLAASVPDGRVMDVFLEINVSGEEAKSGFAAADWRLNPAVRAALSQSLRTIAALPALRVRGLMTMAPIVAQMADTRPVFASLRELRDWLQADTAVPLPDLSMGMTDDYPVAIEEGATVIRVGRALFGERQH